MDFKVKCENCGKITPHTQRGEAVQNDEIDWGEDEPAQEIHWNNLLLQCDLCESVSLHYFSPEVREELTQQFPIIKNLNGVPANVAKSYSEAKKVKNISSLAFSTLIRRALESVCIDQKAVGKDLNKKLEDLGKKGIIPQTLSKMSHAIRYFGNIGAHASDIEISVEEVQTMDDFFVAVLEYVYIAPQKLKRVEELMKKKNK